MNNQKIVTLGEIMLRLSSPRHNRMFQNNYFEYSLAGSEVNVAVDLSILGEKTEFVSVLPCSDLGQFVIKEMNKENVSTKNCIRNDERLGVFYLEKGANQRPSKVIYDREYSGIAKIDFEKFDWDRIFDNCKWFHISGITPALSETARMLSLRAVEIAREKAVTVSIDLNYRGKLWNYGQRAVEVVPEIAKYADVIIGNEEDAQKALGIFISDDDDLDCDNIKSDHYHLIGRQMLEQYPACKKVAISLRESHSANDNTWKSILIDKDGCFASKAYEIKNIVDRVGAGDSFAASLVYALNHSGNMQYIIDFATAASCLKHSIVGDFNYVSVSEVESLLYGNDNGRIDR